MNQAVIYARVSSREQEREGYSIPAQLKLLNEYATKHDLKIAKEFTDNETAKKEGIVLSEKSRSYDKFIPEIKLSEGLGCENIFWIIIMEFLDPHNFDLRSVKRGCVHISHSGGSIISSDIYNVFYSDNKINSQELARG